MGLSDTAIKNKFLSTVKDVQVEKQLGASAEFNKCRTDNAFKDGDDETKKNEKLQKAKDCFKSKLPKDEAALKKLSNSLGLESYGLVTSNNVNDITEYLQNKMTKSLTGRDPNEKDPKKIIEQMKWKNQKIVDQKVFVDLYKNQLMKNALFEVSRYCFEDLRVVGSSEVSFAKHWDFSNMQSTVDKTGKKVYVATPASLGTLTDDGNPPFFKLPSTVDTSKKDEVQKAIVDNLADGNNINPALYEAYFSYCSTALPLLCQDYKENKLTVTPVDTTSTGATGYTKGAKSCLVLDRLKNIRKAMDDTDKVAKQFDEMEGEAKLTMLENPKFYERGNGQGEESLDELTAMSSSDMLVNSEKNKDLTQLEKDCRDGKGTKCDDYLVETDGFEKSLHNIEHEMTLKREAEVARVNLLKNKPKELKEYLTENGMYDLLNRMESNDPSFMNNIEAEIAKIYDARKIAMVEGLKMKIGKRQISETDKKKITDPKTLDGMKADNIKESREEKARLAQVVLFNNIITSQLSLKDKDDKSLGRNVTAWNKEIKGISDSSDMSEKHEYFQGLQKTAKDEGKNINNASLVDGGIIDTILGKKSDAKKP